MATERERLALEETRFKSAILALRASYAPSARNQVARELHRAEDAMQAIEREIAVLPERDVWHTKALALAAILERERERLRELPEDSVTEKLKHHDSLIDRALQQVEEARGVASDTAALLADNREKIESANQRTIAFQDAVDGARGVVVRMKARDNRQCWLVTALIIFLLGTVAATAVILAGRV